jgi:hypothetical protein
MGKLYNKKELLKLLKGTEEYTKKEVVKMINDLVEKLKKEIGGGEEKTDGDDDGEEKID